MGRILGILCVMCACMALDLQMICDRAQSKNNDHRPG